MAKISAAFTTYDAKANREDLSDIINNIDPFDTPVVTAIGSGKRATNRSFDWQTEALRAVNRTNAKVEGDATTRNASTPTTREGNVTQILEDNATVSGSQEAGNPAGKKKEMSHQMSLVSKALKRDLEAIISGEQALVEGSDGTARRTRALEHFIQTNVSYGATGANGASKTAPLTDGTPRAFTESLQNAVLQLCYENGGEPSLIVLGPGPKRTFSSFVGRAATQVQVGQKTVTNTVEVYQSDFGTLKAVPSRFSRARTALYLDPQYASLRWYRPWHTETLGKIGDADTNVIRGEVGLEVGNEKAHGKVADLITTGPA
jgi:hypothetical protein